MPTEIVLKNLALTAVQDAVGMAASARATKTIRPVNPLQRRRPVLHRQEHSSAQTCSQRREGGWRLPLPVTDLRVAERCVGMGETVEGILTGFMIPTGNTYSLAGVVSPGARWRSR